MGERSSENGNISGDTFFLFFLSYAEKEDVRMEREGD